MAKVNVLVLTGYGTNSHAESAHAALLAGADRADIVHFSDIVEGEARLEDYHMLYFPEASLTATIWEPPRPRRSAGCILRTRPACPCWII